MHPYEAIFVKESWPIGEPHLSPCTKWAKKHFVGRDGTDRSFEEDMYWYAICKRGGNAKTSADRFVPELAGYESVRARQLGTSFRRCIKPSGELRH